MRKFAHGPFGCIRSSNQIRMDKYGWTKAGASGQARRAKVLLMLTARANREIWECIGLILTKKFKALSLSATHAFLYLVYPRPSPSSPSKHLPGWGGATESGFGAGPWQHVAIVFDGDEGDGRG
jgi:hypothetical protein